MNERFSEENTKSGVERRWSLVNRDLVIKRYEELSEEVKNKNKKKQLCQKMVVHDE